LSNWLLRQRSFVQLATIVASTVLLRVPLIAQTATPPVFVIFLETHASVPLGTSRVGLRSAPNVVIPA